MGLFGQPDPPARLRRDMVEYQLKQRGIRDQAVLIAMGTLPREEFVAPQHRHSAYMDGPLPIGGGQTISQPYMVALMTEHLALQPQHKVLEIGTGSGYQTALLLHLAGHVYSIERLEDVGRNAKETLIRLGYSGLNIRIADGSLGWPEEAPFDRILVTSAAPGVPEPLKEQLADGGRIVIPVGPRHSQTLMILTKTAAGWLEHESVACVFVPLIGACGWDCSE